LGVIGLFGIERFIAPHSHENDARERHHPPSQAGVAEETSCGTHSGKGEGHEHHPEKTSFLPEHRAAAPAVAGWMAVLGLTIHTFMNGVGLAGAVQFDLESQGRGGSLWTGTAIWALPGLAMFLAIVFHKPADALAVSTVLFRKGTGRTTLMLIQLGFALMVPLGLVAFFGTRGTISHEFQNQVTGAALSFSCGTFLFVSLSDLLPEVQFHRHDRIPLFLVLVLGVGLMGGIALLEEHYHGHQAPPAEKETRDK